MRSMHRPKTSISVSGCTDAVRTNPRFGAHGVRGQVCAPPLSRTPVSCLKSVPNRVRRSRTPRSGRVAQVPRDGGNTLSRSRCLCRPRSRTFRHDHRLRHGAIELGNGPLAVRRYETGGMSRAGNHRAHIDCGVAGDRDFGVGSRASGRQGGRRRGAAGCSSRRAAPAGRARRRDHAGRCDRLGSRSPRRAAHPGPPSDHQAFQEAPTPEPQDGPDQALASLSGTRA